MLELIKDLYDLLKLKRKFWLAPVVLILLVIGLLIAFAQGSVVAPLIYTFF